MGWWPFGRKRRKQKAIKDAEKAKSHTAPTTTLPSIASTAPRTPVTSPSTRPLNEKSSNVGDRSNNLRQSSAQPRASRKASAEDITALPIVADQRSSSPHLRQAIEPTVRARSLHHSSSRREFNLSRAISRKSKRDSHEREQQVREMSAAIPIPQAATEEDSLGRLFRRGSKRRRSAIGRDFSQHGSVVSLPATSIRSGVTGMSESHRYEVGAMDILSARPTIRYSWQPNQPMSPGSADPRSGAPSRSESRRGKGKEVRPLSRKTLREGKTVDNLAEEYDAHGIRELMERDQRRRDRRRKAQEDQARRRLERAVAKQDDIGSSSTDNPFTGLGLAGVEAGPSSPVAMRRPTHPLEREMMENELIRDATQNEAAPPAVAEKAKETDPFADPEEAAVPPQTQDSMPPRPLSTVAGNEQRFSAVSGSSVMLTPTTLERRKPSFPSNTKDIQSEGLESATPPSTAATDRRPSETGSRRGGGFASLFRRSGTGKRAAPSEEQDRVTPSQMSFSNTSRESMSRQPLPAHLREQTSSPQIRPIGITRTRSKFREDLPEYPDSAAETGAQSSEAEPVPPLPKPIPVPGAQAGRGDNRQSLSGATSPVEAVLSQSIASVDSEGSWLSGRPAPRKRASTLLQSAPVTVSEHDEGDSQSHPARPDNEVVEQAVQPIATDAPAVTGTAHDQQTDPRQLSTGSAHESGPDDGRYSPSEYGGSQLEVIEESPGKSKTQHVRQISSGSARLLDISPRSPTTRLPGE